MIWGGERAYELGEMRTTAMPRQLPRKTENARTDLGRNCALFEEGRHEVYRLNRAMDFPHADALYRAALSHLLDLNSAIPHTAGGPLDLAEVRSIASSMARWTAEHHTAETFRQRQSWAGTRAGKKSGQVRRQATTKRIQEFIDE